MDHIDQHLATSAINNTYHPSIQALLKVGKDLLNKYYNMTDHLELYQISMGEFSYTLRRTSCLINHLLSPSPKPQAQIL